MILCNCGQPVGHIAVYRIISHTPKVKGTFYCCYCHMMIEEFGQDFKTVFNKVIDQLEMEN